MSTPTLSTERLMLRRPDHRDWSAFRDFCLGGGMRYIESADMNQADAFTAFGRELAHWEIYGFGSWTVTPKGDADTCLGMIGPWAPPTWPEKELGWMVFPQTQGKSIAFEAAEAARRHIYQVLGWETLVSYIDPDNARSIALAERLGARRDDDCPRLDPNDLVYRHPSPQELTDAA